MLWSLRPASLQGRLLVAMLGLVSLVWLVTAWATWHDARHELDELMDGHLAQAAALLVAHQLHEIEESQSGQGIHAPSLHRYAPSVAFQVWHRGALTLRSDLAPPEPMARVGPPYEQGFRTLRLDKTDWRVFATHGAHQDVQVIVGERLAARRHILVAVLRSTLWPMALALPLLALVSWWAVRSGLAPLRDMGQELAARDSSALQAITLPDAPQEMRPMVDALNALFGRISALLVSERRFTADASHELRTPLAALRAQAQVALGSQDERQRQHALRATLEGCDRAARLVDQLLLLSRLEGAEVMPLQQVNLNALLRQAAGELAPRALQRQQRLELEDSGDVSLEGNEVLLGSLFGNLLDNALRYSPNGAQVRLRVSREQDAPVVTVEDSGPGLDPANLKRLGERFFRVLGTGQTGSGLGWSIVRRIAQAHAASLDVDRSPSLGGLRVRVRWPPVRH